MKMLVPRACLWLVFAALAGCDSAESAKPALTMYRSIDGNFQLLMPAGPVEKSRDEVFPNGTLTTHTVSAGPTGKLEFGVLWRGASTTARRVGKISDMLDLAITQRITNSRGTELGRTTIDLDGHPGREVRFQVASTGAKPRMLGRLRVYFIGGRVYEILIFATEALADPAVSKEFFDSFTLINPVAVSPESEGAGPNP